jgi:formylglycine-generating enzyme required for sulfatase activity
MRIYRAFAVLSTFTLLFVLPVITIAQEPNTTLNQKNGNDGAPMVLIPAGEFQMGIDNSGDGDESPVHAVSLDAFYMDVYEVSNSLYTQFLNQYGRNRDDSGNILVQIGDECCCIEKVKEIYRPRRGYENHPVVYVSWYGALEYARFYGKRLPTEAEWEKAARGGLAGKLYPWGDSISRDNANYGGNGGRDDWSATSPVGSFPPNDYGLYDVSGNVGEWCADWYDGYYYAVCPKTSPSGPDTGSCRVLRGGSWLCNTNGLRVANRCSCLPASINNCHGGFRCVEDVNP